MADPAAPTLSPTTLKKLPATVKEKPAAQTLYVLDTTATAEYPTRSHEMIVDGGKRVFAFTHGLPLPLPPAVALKFLKHDAFKLTDETGALKEFHRRPKQPDELEAGERLVVKEDETIARYDELSTPALQHRVLEMPGSDQFADNPSRSAMIKFIIAHTVKVKAENVSRERDIGPDDYVPELGLLEDEAA